jgi:hypothetical protein
VGALGTACLEPSRDLQMILLRRIFIGLVSYGLVGCRTYEQIMRFPSPSGSAVLEVWQTKLANELGARAVLVAAGTRRTVWQSPSTENLIYFVHVYWTPDEKQIAMFGSGGLIWEEAFDVMSGQSIPFAQFREAMGEAIRNEYQLEADVDPFHWGAESYRPFRQRHPETDLSYSRKPRP